MKRILSKSGRRLTVAIGLGALLTSATVQSFPPAPHHTISGMARNEWGDPLSLGSGQVIFESGGRIGGKASVLPGVVPGGNFLLPVSMDAGGGARLYKPTAMRPFLPFTLKVQIGQAVYLPTQMSCTNYALGRPAESTWLDLTLGIDSDCDGMPDAWELALLRALGRGQSAADLLALRPGGDEDGDGLTNLQEYLAGTYAYDPSDGFSLSVIAVQSDATVLEFLAIQGRSYTVEASANLQQWAPVSFRVLTAGVPGPLNARYTAQDVQFLQIAVPHPTGVTNRYFKALVQ